MYTFLSFQPLASENVYWFEIILFYEHYHGAKVASCRYIFKENNSNIGYFAIHFPTS